MNTTNLNNSDRPRQPKEKNRVKLKVCGMKYPDNIMEVAQLTPDYMGFIFYEKSPRNVEYNLPKTINSIKKVGVFVDADLDFLFRKVIQHDLNAVQLHGNESAEYCKTLRQKLDSFFIPIENETKNTIEIFKVFSVKNEFDFEELLPYEGIVDYFLFDTKGKEKGGNGYTFDWGILKKYPSTTPIILSGGIGLNELNDVKDILETNIPIYALDVNSKFEDEPGLKNIETLKLFIDSLDQI